MSFIVRVQHLIFSFVFTTMLNQKLKAMKKTTLLLIMITGFFLSSAFAENEKEINKTFDAKEILKVNVVSSDCDIEKGTADKIVVKIIYTYDDDCYEVDFIESGNELEIKEDFHGSCRGESNMTIQVPENIFVKFNSASGDFALNGTKKGAKVNVASGDIKITNVVGDVDMNAASGDMRLIDIEGEVELSAASGDLDVTNITGSLEATTASGNMVLVNITNGLEVSAASGDVDAEKISGEIEIKTASGDITAKNINGDGEIKAASGDIDISTAKGAFKVKAASGDINAMNMEFTGSSDFGAASGNLNISLSAVLNYDLELTSASGNSVLDFNGNEIKGYVEMSAREDKGKIISDVKFDKEIQEKRDGKTFDVKSFTKGGDTPNIYIKTYSGIAKLIK
jgi:Toastrack DUF4097